MAEQFHLSRLQVINWGVFDGYHSIPFSSGGALIAGASGSGKSSLLDAISLASRRSPHFNASGDNTARIPAAAPSTNTCAAPGANVRRRHQPRDVPARRRHRVVDVAVTYASDSGRTVTGLVPGGHRRIPQRLVEPVRARRRRPHIEDVCSRWAAAASTPACSRKTGGFPQVGSHYLAQPIGIRAPTPPSSCSGKAVAEKRWRPEQFVREFMLDEPDSPTGRAKALKQIDPLVEPANYFRRAETQVLGTSNRSKRCASDPRTRHHRLARRPMVRPTRPARPVPPRIATLGTMTSSRTVRDVTRSLNLAKAGGLLNAQIAAPAPTSPRYGRR